MIDFAGEQEAQHIPLCPEGRSVPAPTLAQPSPRPSGANGSSGSIEHCRSLDVDPMIGVSPGLSMRYSSDEDAGLLEEKTLDLVGLGASRIALLLDDIPDRSTAPRRHRGLPRPRHGTRRHRQPDRRGAGTDPGNRWWSVPPSIGVTVTRSTSRRFADQSRPSDRSLLDREGGVLAGHHRRRGGPFRPSHAPTAPLLGQLPGQRRGHDQRDAHRAISGP